MVAVTRDQTGGEFGRLVEFNDLDGEPRREVIGDRERRGRATPCGLAWRPWVSRSEPAPRPGNCFLSLLRRWTPEARARSVTRTGWTDGGGAFVLPDRVLGEGPEPVILATEGERPAFGTRGTLDDWRRACRPVVHRQFTPDLRAFPLAFAPPLLRLTGTESGGFHLGDIDRRQFERQDHGPAGRCVRGWVRRISATMAHNR